MDSDHKHSHRDAPKTNPSSELTARIVGLEKAKTYPDMTRADIAALDRVIAKLKVKLSEQNIPKKEDKEEF